MDIVGYNDLGRPIVIPEQPLEPPDCWAGYEEEITDDERDF